jgi:hypothetical protein
VQQLSGGIASVLAGLIVVAGPDGALLHFERLGYVVAGASLVTLFMMNRIRRVVPERSRVRTHVRDTGADPTVSSTHLYTARAEQD